MKAGGRYRKGYRFERDKVNELNSKYGHLAFRSAGSHKIFDIIDIDFATGTITLMQLKRKEKNFYADKELLNIHEKMVSKGLVHLSNNWRVEMYLVSKEDYKKEEVYPV